MGPICFAETLVDNYHTTVRNIPEEHRSHQHRNKSLNSRPDIVLYDPLNQGCIRGTDLSGLMFESRLENTCLCGGCVAMFGDQPLNSMDD
jgi:hypothetical protein